MSVAAIQNQRPMPQLHYHPNYVNSRVRTSDVYSNIQQNAHMIRSDRVHITPSLPKAYVNYVRIGNDEVFKGRGMQHPPQPQPPHQGYPQQPPHYGQPMPGHPYQPPHHGGPLPIDPVGGGYPNQPSQPYFPPHPGYPSQPGQAPPAGPPDLGNLDPVKGRKGYSDYMKGIGRGVEHVGNGLGTTAMGAGDAVAGTAKSMLYAPLAGVEILGRTAVALTGGKTQYENGTPAEHMVDGWTLAGHGALDLVRGTGEVFYGAGKIAYHAPVATAGVAARGVGVAAGGVAVVGYAAYKGAAWAGKQVEDTFVAQEFMDGFKTVIGNGPPKK